MSRNAARRAPAGAERFPIRILAERTGVGSSTLRAWERRYGLLSPERTPKGHRLYTEADVARIERIRTLLEEGHALAAIARRLGAGAGAGAGAGEGPAQAAVPAGVWGAYVRATLAAIHDFSVERVEAVYNEASSLYPVDLVTERLIDPVLGELGAQWQRRAGGIAEEHFYAGWVRNRIGARFHHAYAQARGARILCACLPGVHHEIGLMLFSLSALARGYRALYLGADLPLDQVPPVVERAACRAVVLSARTAVDESLHAPLAALCAKLAVPVFLGGFASDAPLPWFEQAGGVRLGSRIAVAARVLAARVPAVGVRGAGA